VYKDRYLTRNRYDGSFEETLKKRIKKEIEEVYKKIKHLEEDIKKRNQNVDDYYEKHKKYILNYSGRFINDVYALVTELEECCKYIGDWRYSLFHIKKYLMKPFIEDYVDIANLYNYREIYAYILEFYGYKWYLYGGNKNFNKRKDFYKKIGYEIIYERKDIEEKQLEIKGKIEEKIKKEKMPQNIIYIINNILKSEKISFDKKMDLYGIIEENKIKEYDLKNLYYFINNNSCHKNITFRKIVKLKDGKIHFFYLLEVIHNIIEDGIFYYNQIFNIKKWELLFDDNYFEDEDFWDPFNIWGDK